MRILMLSVSAHLGGSEAMLLQILRQVRRVQPGWAFHVVLPADGPLAEAAAAEGADVCLVPMPAALRQLGEWGAGATSVPTRLWRLLSAGFALPSYEHALRRAVRALAPDVIHSNGFKSHVVSARIPDRPAVVWHIHEYVTPRPLTRRLLARYAHRATAIVANSRSVAADLRQVTAGDVTTVHNAVDLERFSPVGAAADLDAAAGMPAPAPGTVRVGLVATFSRWKGHETFFKAVARLPADLPVRAYVIGGPVYDTSGSQYSRAELEALAASLGVRGRVGFTGFLAPVDEALRGLDVVVHASTDPEAFGLVIAEALACGRAVVSSATGGARELFDEGDSALTHAAGDPGSLADVLQRVVADEGLRARLGARAREHAVAHFDGRRLGPQFAAIYQDAAARPEA